MRSIFATTLAAIALATSLHAQAPTFPLPTTAGSTTATESTAPFVVPAGVKQTKLTDRNAMLAAGLPTSFSNWDMVAFDPSSRYIFIPTENFAQGAGVFRFDTVTGQFVTLMAGNGTGSSGRTSNPAAWNPANDEFTSLDPATFTPFGTVITGEETTGGRLFEILNPLSASGPFNVVWRSKIPAVAHEGLRFDGAGSLYFVDESNTGSIYKFVPTVPGDLSNGQTFVLSVNAYASDLNANAASNWDASANLNAIRTGAATWLPITDSNGNALTIADPFAYVTTTGGRTAADELKGTPYGRPEDLDISVLANGKEVVYVATTSENRVYSIELLTSTTAMVRVFVDFNTINLATGLDVNPLQATATQDPGPHSITSFDNPDNICVDAFGSIYVIEDNTPGNIWKAVDADDDGVAEAMGLFASLGVAGAEPTGLIADPNDPFRFILCIQHPASGNDALWSFDTRPFVGTNDDLTLSSGVNGTPNHFPGEFIKNGQSGDLYSLRIESPTGDQVGAPFVLIADLFFSESPFTTGPTFLHLDPNGAIVLIDGIAGLFPQLVPQGGVTFLTSVPVGLGGLGLSAMFQCAALSPNTNNFFFAVSDGHELRLVP